MFYDPFVDETTDAEKVDDHSTLFATCKIISIHSPLTVQTNNMVNEKVLKLAKGIILINTSRAAIVNRTALISGLQEGYVFFYGADVNWDEPANLKDAETAKLLAMNQVLITPHSGWYSEESETDVRRKAAQEIARVIEGNAPLHIV
jgi:D-3-phosphoglycerate dehydrogenase